MRRVPWILILVVALVASGCSNGDDDSTAAAQQAVCDDASSLEQAVDAFVDDLTDLDLGSAKDKVPSIVDAATTLGESVRDLGGDKKADLKGQVDDLESTLGDLTSASSIDAIGETLATAKSQVESILDTVTDTLSCG